MYTIMWELGMTSYHKHHMIGKDLLPQRNLMCVCVGGGLPPIRPKDISVLRHTFGRCWTYMYLNMSVTWSCDKISLLLYACKQYVPQLLII